MLQYTVLQSSLGGKSKTSPSSKVDRLGSKCGESSGFLSAPTCDRD